MTCVKVLRENSLSGPINYLIFDESRENIILLKGSRMKLVKSVYILDREYTRDEMVEATMKIHASRTLALEARGLMGHGIELFSFEINECGYVHHIYSYDISYEELEDIARMIKRYVN